MSLNTRRSSYKPQSNNKLPIELITKIALCISLVIYLILFPPFLKNQTLTGHDISAHLTYLRIFTDALSQGQFPVRWIEWSSLGQSQPLFSFYQPLLYYLASVIHLFGFSILSSLYITLVTLWLLSGLLMFLFIRNLTRSSLGGAVASLMYVFAPYHILDVFVRAAYPEATALAFVPGVFYALERFFTTKKLVYLSLNAVFFAAIFLSHPPTLIMFSLPIAVFLTYLIYKEYKEKDLKTTLRSGLGAFLSFILGIGISSFFSVPAFLNQNLIKASSLNAGYLDFHKHYTCLLQLFDPSWDYGVSNIGCKDQMSFQFGIINWVVLIIFISSLIYMKLKKIKTENNNYLTIIFIVISLISLYMTTSFSQPFWEKTPYLAFIQFTWRFLAVAIFSASVLGGILFIYLKNKTHQLIVFLALVISIPLFSFSYLQPAQYLPTNYFKQDSNDFYSNTLNSTNGNAELGYMPKNVEVLALPQNIPASQIQLDDKSAQIRTLINNFHYKEWDIQSPKSTQGLIFIHYFPGWKFKINNQEAQINANNMYGLVSISIPQGQNKIIAKFENTPLISLVNLISLISIIITLLIPLYKIKLKINLNREEA